MLSRAMLGSASTQKGLSSGMGSQAHTMESRQKDHETSSPSLPPRARHGGTGIKPADVPRLLYDSLENLVEETLQPPLPSRSKSSSRRGSPVPKSRQEDAGHRRSPSPDLLRCDKLTPGPRMDRDAETGGMPSNVDGDDEGTDNMYKSCDKLENCGTGPPQRVTADGKVWYMKPPPQPVLQPHICDEGRCRETVRINVSGHCYDICISYLDKFPDSLLGKPKRRASYWDGWRQEFFLDRHRLVFASAFDYYRFNVPIVRPPEVPSDVYLAELSFYGLDPFDKVDDLMGEPVTGPWLWRVFEEPQYSWTALLVNCLSVCATIATIVSLCLETVEIDGESMSNGCLPDGHANWLDPFFVVETVSNCWFTLEFTCRLLSCPYKKGFVMSPLNCCDFAAMIPYYIMLFYTVRDEMTGQLCGEVEASNSNMLLGFLRVLRVLRVFKLAKHARPLQVLLRTFADSAHMLKTFLLTLCISVLVFSHVFLTLEPSIVSLHDAAWYALISMTTVGYGDIYPETLMGKVAGACCVLAGVLTISLPIPVLSENFQKYYSRR